MCALCDHGPKDIRYERIADPQLVNFRSAETVARFQSRRCVAEAAAAAV